MTMPMVPRGAHDAECEGTRIAALDHRRNEDRAHRQGRGDARAADRREQRAGDDGHEAERAAYAAEPSRRQIDERLGDATEPHEGGGHDEKRQGHQGRRVELVDDELRHADQGLIGEIVERRRANPEDEKDRRSGHEQAEKQSEEQEAPHERRRADATAWCRKMVPFFGSYYTLIQRDRVSSLKPSHRIRL
jgi:hypothetical protein